MNTNPIGRIKTRNVLVAPVVVAASALAPKCATRIASERPTTVWVARESTTGHAKRSRSRNDAGLEGSIGPATVEPEPRFVEGSGHDVAGGSRSALLSVEPADRRVGAAREARPTR